MSESERIAGRILDECFADYAAAFWFDRHAAASVIKSEFSSLRATLTARESELAAEIRRVENAMVERDRWFELYTTRLSELAEAQRVVIRNALAAQPQEGE